MAVTPNKNETSSRPSRAGQGTSLAAGGRLEGKFQFVGPVIVGAHIRGEIESDDLILVEATGKIEGRIRAATLIVHGSVSGDVEASRGLEVCTGGRLEGVAFAPSMRVEERTIVNADLLIATERTVAHVNKVASIPDMSKVAPLSPRAEAPAVTTDTPASTASEADAKTATG